MPHTSDVASFIATHNEHGPRCIILQREGSKDGVYGLFTNEITAASVHDAAVVKSLFDEAYKTLRSSNGKLWDMNSLPISHFIGLYPVTLLIQRHNTVVDVVDTSSRPVQAYMGVEG